MYSYTNWLGTKMVNTLPAYEAGFVLENHVLNAVAGTLSAIMSKHLFQSSLRLFSFIICSCSLFLLLLHCKVTTLIPNFKITFPYRLFAIFKSNVLGRVIFSILGQFLKQFSSIVSSPSLISISTNLSQPSKA